MSDVVSLSEQLTDEEWYAEIEQIGNRDGYFVPLGPHHGAAFGDIGEDVLVVCFDTVTSAREGSASGLPFGMDEARRAGWSYLSLIARKPTWFRDPTVYAFFDRLIDDDFFADYETVIFYGAGSCAYAAAAYSVASPEAIVFALAPQATLDPEIAPWDDRFVQMRRTSFTDRYGYAPDMIEAASEVWIIYDPLQELDAMHAVLFHGDQVQRIRHRHGGARIGTELQAMGVMGPLLEMAVEGMLTETAIYRALRRRKDYLPYLRSLLNRVHIEERYWLTALLCRSVLKRKNAPRFRHHLELSEHKLLQEGKLLPSTSNDSDTDADKVNGPASA
ncbi:MAG: phosphoadenosine phosphosulfate reductase [Pseudomonadota bacterium]